MKIGFIGQGFVGKSYADDFESRGFAVVRYALEPAYAGNRDQIAECDIVSISVPTPTTPAGLDISIIEAVLPLVGVGKTAVIRSTILPGTTERFQQKFPRIIILHAPEFLLEASAAQDAARPAMNIIGLALESAVHREKAAELLSVLPQARNNFIMPARDAELMKFIHNTHGYMRIVYTNLMYDLAEKIGCDWGTIRGVMDADPMLSPYYNKPIHKNGRGAGGACFIKDFAAFHQFYMANVQDPKYLAILENLEAKNLELLAATGKNQDIVEAVYGKK